MYESICLATKQGIELPAEVVPTIKDLFPRATITQFNIGPEIKEEVLHCDLLAVIGGDGTLLRAAMALDNPKVPILHINMGRRGYLAEIEFSEFYKALARVKDGDFILESVNKVSVVLNGKRLQDASNELALVTSSLAGIAYFELDIQTIGKFELEGNGVIIATPIGSTAFSLIAGGPVIPSCVPCLIVDSLLSRQRLPSFVIPSEYRVSVKLKHSKHACIVIVDGVKVADFDKTDSIVAAGSENKINLIRLSKDFLQRRVNMLLE